MNTIASSFNDAFIERMLDMADISGSRVSYDHSVDPAVTKVMRRNKRRDTQPELLVRKLLRTLGYPGYRVDWRKAPGHPDIAYPGRKIAIFVHGCFWHRCPVCDRPIPKKNHSFWQEKFEKNVNRDLTVKTELEKMGWKVIVIWEHQLRAKELENTAEYLYEVLSSTDKESHL